MHHIDVAVELGVVAGFVAGAFLTVAARRRVFAGEALNRWLQTRRRLGLADRWRVSWATTRRRPIGRADLAPAQLAFVEWRQDAAKRAPLLRKRWLRAGLPVIYGCAALCYVIAAVAERGGLRVYDVVLGVLFLAVCLLWAVAVPRSVRREPERMARLRRRIDDRYAN